MADATLAIHLIDDGAGAAPSPGPSSPAPIPSSPDSSAPRSGPQTAPAAGPPIPVQRQPTPTAGPTNTPVAQSSGQQPAQRRPADTQRIRDTDTIGPPNTSGQLATQQRSQQQRWRTQEDNDVSGVKDASVTLLTKLAGAAGLGGIVTQMRFIVGIFNDVMRLFKAVAPRVPSLTPNQPTHIPVAPSPRSQPPATTAPTPAQVPTPISAPTHGPAAAPSPPVLASLASTPEPPRPRVSPTPAPAPTPTSPPVVPVVPVVPPPIPATQGPQKSPASDVRPEASLMRQQGEILEQLKWSSGDEPLPFDISPAQAKNVTSRQTPQSRASAEHEFQREAVRGRPTTGPSNAPVTPTQALAKEGWQSPKGFNLQNVDLGRTPGPVNLPRFGGVTQHTELAVASKSVSAAVKPVASVAPAAIPTSVISGQAVGSGAAAGVSSALGGGAAGQAAGAAVGTAVTAGATKVATALSGTAAAILANPIGIAVAAVVAGATALGIAIMGMTKLFRSQTEKLSGYSIDAAMAGAMTDLRKELTTINRAEQIGPQVAKWETAGSKFDDSVDRLGTQVLKMFDKFGQPVLDALSIATGLTQRVEELFEWFNSAPTGPDVAGWFSGIGLQLNIMGPLLRQIAEFLKPKEEVEGFPDPFMDAFMGQPPGIVRPGFVPHPPIPVGNPGGPFGPPPAGPQQQVGW